MTAEIAANGKKKSGEGVRVRIIGAVAIAIAIVLAFYTFGLAGKIASYEEIEKTEEMQYLECNDAIENLKAASDFLTQQARLYVTTGRRECMDAYMDEIQTVNRRGIAVETLREVLVDDQDATSELESALSISNGLTKREYAAMRLAADYYGEEDLPDEVANASLGAVREDLDAEVEFEAAKTFVLDSTYDEMKQTISSKVNASSSALLAHLDSELEMIDGSIQVSLFQLRITVALLLCTIMVLVLALFMYVLKPLDRYIKRIEKSEPLEADGSYELHYLADAYNAMYEDNVKRIEQLRESAERDTLTGISNRAGFDAFLAKHTRDVALLLINIDDFKGFNKVYGRDVGDAVLVKLAEALNKVFRSTDYPCRVEGDQFAVVMTRMGEDARDVVFRKLELINNILADDSDDLPLITFSAGVAFGAEGMTDEDLSRAAGSALRQAQEQGISSLVFYGESGARDS